MVYIEDSRYHFVWAATNTSVSGAYLLNIRSHKDKLISNWCLSSKYSVKEERTKYIPCISSTCIRFYLC